MSALHAPKAAGAPSLPSAAAAPAAAATASYREELRRWHENAALSDVQEHCLQELHARRHSLVQRPLPPHLRDGEGEGDAEAAAEAEGAEAPAPAEGDGGAAQGDEGSLTIAPPRTKEDFYSWFGAVDAKVERQRRAATESQIVALQAYHDECDELVAQTGGVLQRLERMRQCYVTVQQKTREVHEQCDSLLRDKDELVAYADAIRAKLAYFDELDRIGAVFSAATTEIVKDSRFLGYLERLDECVAYVSVNLQYKDAELYGDRFRALQARGLGFIVDHFNAVLRETTLQVLPEVQKWMSSTQAAAEAAQAAAGGTAQAAAPPPAAVTFAEESLLYAKYRAVGGPLKDLMGEIERRRSTNELCVEMLLECQSSFLQIRQTLLGDIIHAHLDAMRDAAAPQSPLGGEGQLASEEDPVDLASFARQGWGYMMRLCEREHGLWCAIFPQSAPSQGLRALIEDYTTMLYDYLRPMYLHESTFEQLVDCVHVLKVEVMADEMGRRGVSTGFCRPTIERSIGDLQSKLIFLTQTFIRDDIESFEPAAHDLDYPAVLKKQQAAQSQETAATESSSNRVASRDASSLYDSWYPPLRSVLLCLAKLYRCVDAGVFSELAHEAVHTTTQVLLEASSAITTRATRNGQLHGGLFLVKNLLTLREQIQPFDVDFSSHEISLDFTNTQSTLTSLISNASSGFAGALMEALTTGAPAVTETRSDSKRELEDALRNACEDFIELRTKQLVGPLLALTAKLKSLIEHEQKHGGQGDRDRSFASSSNVLALLEQVAGNMARRLPALNSAMVLYLPNSGTRRILFTPIVAHVVEAYAQLAAVVTKASKSESGDGVGLYSEAEIATLQNAVPGREAVAEMVEGYASQSVDSPVDCDAIDMDHDDDDTYGSAAHALAPAAAPPNADAAAAAAADAAAASADAAAASADASRRVRLDAQRQQQRPEPEPEAEPQGDEEAENAERERAAAQQAEQERIAAEQAEQERVAAEKAEQERVAAEKAEQERVAAEKAELERVAAEKAELERVAAEKAELERVAAEKAELQRVAAEKAELERVAAETAAAPESQPESDAGAHEEEEELDEEEAAELAAMAAAAAARKRAEEEFEQRVQAEAAAKVAEAKAKEEAAAKAAASKSSWSFW